ncbi:MAG: PAC2 family protein [Thermoleophilia bacterium]
MLYDLQPDLPALTEPVMVAALDGWVDAAGAATAAVDRISAGGTVVARFRGDELFDYRSRRPVLDVVDGHLSQLVWPELAVTHVRHGERDLLVLAGAEPDLRWEALARDVGELCRTLGVTQWISLGAVPAAVPHTRPVPVMATASREGLLHNGETPGPSGLLRVPAAALSVLEMGVSDGGLPAVGFFAQVPPYAGTGYAAASVALIEHLGRHLDVSLPAGNLRAAATVEHQRFDQAVETDPETREIVDRLELMGEGESGQERLPTGEELASELERFLREHAGEDPDSPGFGQ